MALELRGTRTTVVNGEAVASQCDPYSLYVQLSRCRTLDGVMLLSGVRQRDFVYCAGEHDSGREKAGAAE
jgi:hypothetical protein